MKIIDISMPIKSGMAVYPKNPKVEIEINSTGHSQVSKITLGSHTGTHVDAPKHVFSDGQSIDNMDLDVFFGPCRVLDMTNVSSEISIHDLKNEKIIAGDRILFKTTNSALNKNTFHEEFIGLDGEAAQFLADQKVKLVGIDYLSIKKYGVNDNKSHTALLEKNIPIIEGLDLSNVVAGEYIFSGLPLKLEDLDGAPTRAVLISEF